MDLQPKTRKKQRSKSVSEKIIVGANCKLNLESIYLFVQNNRQAELSQSSAALMQRSYDFLRNSVDQRISIYGVNTHFGDQVSLIDSQINNMNQDEYHQSINARQQNLIRSHSCGLGDVIDADSIKVAMLLRAHCLSQGYSGVSLTAVTAILTYLNAGIVPLVRCYGSIGASGDLIPLAMIAASITGEEVDVFYQGAVMKAPKALQLAGLTKFIPQLRDGLAMINGTSFMTAIAGLALWKLKRLFKQMMAAIAMCLESMLIITSAFHPLVHQLKQHSGEFIVNNMLLNFWEGSHLVTDLDELRQDATPNKPVQDYYSLRAVSQGFGPFYENLERAIVWIEDEINSVNDNPIIDVENKRIHHNANFMGYYVTDACDILKMNIAQASTWLHALLANMVHPRKSHGLPANIIAEPGKYNGFRPIQLLTAALAVENRKLAQSHQAYTLPTEGDNQDVNSLGTHAALDFQKAVANLERLTAIMFLASSQALEFRGIEKASSMSRTMYQEIRTCSAKIDSCRPMSDEIELTVKLLQNQMLTSH